jgi:hypothetical protein
MISAGIIKAKDNRIGPGDMKNRAVTSNSSIAAIASHNTLLKFRTTAPPSYALLVPDLILNFSRGRFQRIAAMRIRATIISGLPIAIRLPMRAAPRRRAG